jgi:TIR domain
MQSGERVTTIKAAAQALSEESWTDIALTLDQFGFDSAVNEEAPHDKYTQVVEKLGAGTDDNLRALDEYLFPGVEEGPGSDDGAGGPWDEGSFRLFISHTHAHMAFASALRRALDEMGICAFVAHDRIEPTKQWEDELEAALRTCDALVAVLTPDFVKSRWCDQEVGYCMARGVLIVPLGLGADPHGFIGKYQCMTAREDEDAYEVAHRLFDLLIQHEKTAERMVPVIAWRIATRYAESHSFDNARENFEQLQAIPKEYWTEELAEIVERAPSENTQVAYARTGSEQMPDAASRFLDEMLDRPPPVSQERAEEGEIPL